MAAHSMQMFFLLVFLISLTLNANGQGKSTASYDVTTTAPEQTEPTTIGQSDTDSTNTTPTTNSSNNPHLDATPTIQPTTGAESITTAPSYVGMCPSLLNCSDLSVDCLDYKLNYPCVYGREYNVTCTPKPDVNCTGEQTFVKLFRCRYCYQSDDSERSCTPTTKCRVNSNPPTMVRVNCSVHDDVLCLGQRKFYRRNRCNWTSGYRWTMALSLSVTLGGFGVDRFYLGYWREGMGKLFSFGGLGVWTLVDVILIAFGYITPEDGSHYI